MENGKVLRWNYKTEKNGWIKYKIVFLNNQIIAITLQKTGYWQINSAFFKNAVKLCNAPQKFQQPFYMPIA